MDRKRVNTVLLLYIVSSCVKYFLQAIILHRKAPLTV